MQVEWQATAPRLPEVAETSAAYSTFLLVLVAVAEGLSISAGPMADQAAAAVAFRQPRAAAVMQVKETAAALEHLLHLRRAAAAVEAAQVLGSQELAPLAAMEGPLHLTQSRVLLCLSRVVAAVAQPVEQPGQAEQTPATAQTTTRRQERALQIGVAVVAVAVSHPVLVVSVVSEVPALSLFVLHAL